MAMAAVSQHELLILRQIIVQDRLALERWGRVVDHIVTSSADALRILASLNHGSFEDAVLQSLRFFYSRGGSRSGLADMLRSDSIGLNALAERVQDLPTTSSAGVRTSLEATRVTMWGEVGSVVQNFSGRKDEVLDTHKKLEDAQKISRESGAVSFISISGLGGVGKSTLARKYAFTHRDFYHGNVAWINAETMESMRASFMSLSEKLGLQLGDHPPQEFLVEKVINYFEHKKCLFIYDNVEALADLKQFLPNAVDPNRQVPYVLVTSRRTDLNSLPANEIRLGVLKTEEAVELIQKILPKSGTEYSMKLADKLQRLPLALQQALTYIRDTSVGDELKKLNDLSRECMSHGLNLFPYQLKHTHSKAMTANYEYFQALCGYLIDYGNYEEELSISQQMASLYESMQGEKHGITIWMKWRMANAYYRLDRLADSVQILNAILPDAKLMLGIENVLTMNIQSSLASCLGEQSIRDSRKAVQIYEEIIPVAERVFGENDSNVLHYKKDKAMALRLLGNFEQSLELLYYVYKMEVSMHRENSLKTKSDIAVVHYEKKDFTKALEIFEEVEAAFRHVLGHTHPNVVTVRENIAKCRRISVSESSQLLPHRLICNPF